MTATIKPSIETGFYRTLASHTHRPVLLLPKDTSIMAFNFPHRKVPSRVHSFPAQTPSVENLFRPSPDQTCSLTDGIIYDRRVVRANVSGYDVSSTAPQYADENLRQQFRTPVLHKDASVETVHRTPQPPKQPKHSDAQTDLNLGEYGVPIMVTVTTVEEVKETFKPPKTGRDIATQIMEGDLFDFDKEVPPLVEIMVDKIIEQSVLEVREEEELARLSAQQRAFQELRNTEMAEVQRLKEQERRHRKEKERRIAQQQEALRKELELMQSNAVRAYTKEHLAELFPAIFISQRPKDPVEKEIEDHFLPWLMTEVHVRMEKRTRTRQVLDALVKDVGQLRVSRSDSDP